VFSAKFAEVKLAEKAFDASVSVGGFDDENFSVCGWQQKSSLQLIM